MDTKSAAERMKTEIGAKVEAKGFGRTHQIALEVEGADLQKCASWLRNDEQCRLDWVELASCWRGPKGAVLTYFLRSRLSGDELILRARVAPGENIPTVAGVWSTVRPFENEFLSENGGLA